MNCSRCNNADPNCYVCHEPKMKTIFKNVRPVVASLAIRLQRAGYILDAFYDGTHWIDITGNTDRERRQNLKTLLIQQKLGLIRVLDSESVGRTIYVNLHGRPENLARVETVDEGLLEVVREFKQQWSGRKWPSV